MRTNDGELAKEEAQLTREVQIERDRLQDFGPLDLDRHDIPVRPESGSILMKNEQSKNEEKTRALHKMGRMIFFRQGSPTPSRTYDLPEARRGHRLGSYEAENFVDGPSQLPLHRRVGDLRIEARDLIAKLLQFHHAPRTKDVRSDGERLRCCRSENVERERGRCTRGGSG